jgi:hypothetical protein
MMTNAGITEAIRRVDVRRLAGVNRMVGLDLDERVARIVELERYGSLLNKFKARYRPASYFTVEFAPAESVEQKAQRIKEALKTHGVRTRYAVSAVRTVGVKRVYADVPIAIENVNEWIEEHVEKLLRFPVSVRDVAYAYEVIDRNDTSIQLEVTFARRSDIRMVTEIIHQAGLTLMALGAGERDTLNVVLLSPDFSAIKDITVAFFDSDTVEVTLFQKGKRTPTRRSSIETFTEIDSGDNNVFLLGSAPQSLSSERFYQPFAQNRSIPAKQTAGKSGHAPNRNISGQAPSNRRRFHKPPTKKKPALLGPGFHVDRDGIEPPTHGFSVHCSTN